MRHGSGAVLVEGEAVLIDITCGAIEIGIVMEAFGRGLVSEPSRPRVTG